MKLKEFKQKTGLSDKQIRTLTSSGAIPFEWVNKRKCFNERSLEAAKLLFAPKSSSILIGSENVVLRESETSILNFLLLPKRDPADFITATKTLLKERRVRSLRVRLGFHFADSLIASDLCAFCIANGIRFEVEPK